MKKTGRPLNETNLAFFRLISEPATGSITGFWWKIKITSELLDEWWVDLEPSTTPPKWGCLFDIFAMISINQISVYHSSRLASSSMVSHDDVGQIF